MLTAILLSKFILDIFLCCLFFTPIKSDYFQLCRVIKKNISKVRIYRCHPVYMQEAYTCWETCRKYKETRRNKTEEGRNLVAETGPCAG